MLLFSAQIQNISPILATVKKIKSTQPEPA